MGRLAELVYWCTGVVAATVRLLVVLLSGILGSKIERSEDDLILWCTGAVEAEQSWSRIVSWLIYVQAWRMRARASNTAGVRLRACVVGMPGTYVKLIGGERHTLYLFQQAH